MQELPTGERLYSPSDLTSFYACNHISFLAIKNFSEPIEKSPNSAANQLLQQKGIDHESAYLQQLKESGKTIVEIPRSLSMKERAELTTNAIMQGVDVIYQAVLFQSPWRGDADFLLKCNTPSSLGDFSYEVLDTKLAQTAHPKHIIQLCLYSELLGNIQDGRPRNMSLFLGNGILQTFKVDDFFYYYAYVKQQFEHYVNNLPDYSQPDPCNHCQFCQWKNHCSAQWQAQDHLSLIANMQNIQITKLREADINSVEQLAATPAQTKIAHLNTESFQRLRSQAILQHHKATTGQDEINILPPIQDKGFARIPPPNEGDLFFDMEGDPFYPNRLEYLFGIYSPCHTKPFITFWAHNHEQEKEALEAFMGFIVEHLKKYPKAYIYHYNHYETTALKRLSCRYTVYEEVLDNLLRHKKFVDLYFVVRESIQTSEPKYSIKNLEIFYMKKRDNAVTNAADSIVEYNNWRVTGDNDILQNIANYNEVDCQSTLYLRDWLLSLKPTTIPFFEPVASDKPLSIDDQKDWEIEYKVYQKRLEANKNSTADINQSLANFLEYHNREEKPRWWDLFSLRDKFTDELITHNDCLAGLEQIDTATPTKQSLIFSYHFPEQDHKLKVGISVVDTATSDTIGVIDELDEDKRIVRIKRGKNKQQLPETLSICLPGPVSSQLLRRSIYRYADYFLNTPSSAQSLAITELLAKNLPRITGKKSGSAISDTMQAISDLNNSYLVIQGPPGTGKTHTCSHVIVDLIKQGKTIGITSNSHKAIHNLLKKLEQVALAEGIRFTGVKKASTSNADSFYEDTFFSSTMHTTDMELSANCFAGTAWTFAHPHFSAKDKKGKVPPLDYLFIDEAGQVATANVVAMGMATRNIILVGDQVQLSQPVQGIHPDGAGGSVLDYLLGEYNTIPPERGIFLRETYRLHPHICQFISDAFYDNCLNANEVTEQRSINLQNKSLPKLPNHGIAMITTHHENCSQKSTEEANIIANHYKAILGKVFIDHDGQSKTIDEGDILVVTPYNMQVNHLRTLLPCDAKIGTVDKFQGQEAPVVFISMVTSNAKTLQRNVEFLFSQNRLNVAISRAQCLAIVIVNQELLKINCNSVEQIKLINTHCWLKTYATQIATTT